MRHHIVVQLIDDAAACFREQKWKDTMQQASHGCGGEGTAKRKRRAQMLKISFANAVWVLCE
jgi:hypothetical protein